LQGDNARVKPTRLGRAASAALGAVAGVFGGSDAVQADEPDAAPGTPAPREQAEAPPPPAAPAKPPPARKPAAPPGARPIPPQPARVRAVRAKRVADEHRDGPGERR
jgi:hypothetical protein